MNNYKKYFLLIFLLYSSAIAQIPNAGFENWSYDLVHSFNPDGWHTNNGGSFYAPITRSTQSYSDSFAVRGELVWYRTLLVGPLLNAGFNLNIKPIALTGYYQLFPVGGDTLLINVEFYFNKNIIAKSTLPISQGTSSYLPFYVTINYFTNDLPDSCTIAFTIINSSSAYHIGNPGSYFLLDGLSFDGNSSVTDSNKSIPQAFKLHQNYPNPFNPTSRIDYEIPISGYVLLKVYDILSNEIATLRNAYQNAGKHSVVFNGSYQPSGVYFYKIIVGNYSSVRKMLLIK